jgi:hypothetical protein
VNAPRKTGPKPSKRIDAQLEIAELLSSLSPRKLWSDRELAAFCGCNHKLIQLVQEEGIRKLRRRPSVFRLCAEQLRRPPQRLRAVRAAKPFTRRMTSGHEYVLAGRLGEDMPV